MPLIQETGSSAISWWIGSALGGKKYWRPPISCASTKTWAGPAPQQLHLRVGLRLRAREPVAVEVEAVVVLAPRRLAPVRVLRRHDHGDDVVVELADVAVGARGELVEDLQLGVGAALLVAVDVARQPHDRGRVAQAVVAPAAALAQRDEALADAAQLGRAHVLARGDDRDLERPAGPGGADVEGDDAVGRRVDRLHVADDLLARDRLRLADAEREAEHGLRAWARRGRRSAVVGQARSASRAAPARRPARSRLPPAPRPPLRPRSLRTNLPIAPPPLAGAGNLSADRAHASRRSNSAHAPPRKSASQPATTSAATAGERPAAVSGRWPIEIASPAAHRHVLERVALPRLRQEAAEERRHEDHGQHGDDRRRGAAQRDPERERR